MDLQNIGPLTQRVVDSFLEKLQQDDTKKVIKKNIITPVVQTVIETASCYIWFMISLYILILIILCIILYKVW